MREPSWSYLPCFCLLSIAGLFVVRFSEHTCLVPFYTHISCTFTLRGGGNLPLRLLHFYLQICGHFYLLGCYTLTLLRYTCLAARETCYVLILLLVARLPLGCCLVRLPVWNLLLLTCTLALYVAFTRICRFRWHFWMFILSVFSFPLISLSVHLSSLITLSFSLGLLPHTGSVALATHYLWL